MLKNFRIGDTVLLPHPVTGEAQTPTITVFTADEMGRVDGAIVKFDDGGFVEVSAGRLIPPGQNYVPYVDGSGQGW